jgi:hypothetical protein
MILKQKSTNEGTKRWHWAGKPVWKEFNQRELGVTPSRRKKENGG